MRRTGGRRDIQHVREVVFEEVYPSRTAGSQDRKPDGFISVQIACQSVQDFGTFFHDGEVGGKVGIEYIVETQFAEGVNHFSGYQCAGRQAEFFSQGGTYGGGSLDNYDLIGVGQIVQKAVGVIPFGQCAYRAYGYALTAVGTFAVLHHSVEGRGYRCVESAADGSQCADCLYIVADTFASAAEDALVHVAHNGGGHFPFAGRKFAAVERHFTDVEAQCQCLEFTVAAFGTGETVVGMIGQDQFSYHFPGVHHTQGAGFHHHPFRATGSAGGSQIAASCHFDYTDAAGSGIVLDAGSFQVDVTQRRYVDTDFSSGFKNGTSFGDGDKMAVYLEGYLFIFHSNRF